MDIVVVGGLAVGVWAAIGLGAVGAVFILRAVACWYFKLTKIVAVLEEIRDLAVRNIEKGGIITLPEGEFVIGKKETKTPYPVDQLKRDLSEEYGYTLGKATKLMRGAAGVKTLLDGYPKMKETKEGP